MTELDELNTENAKKENEMSEENDNRISIDDLPQAEQELTAEEAKDVKGGLIGLLLPAVQSVQKVREPAKGTTTAGDNLVQGNLIGTD